MFVSLFTRNKKWNIIGLHPYMGASMENGIEYQAQEANMKELTIKLPVGKLLQTNLTRDWRVRIHTYGRQYSNYGGNNYDKHNKTCYGCRLIIIIINDGKMQHWKYVQRMCVCIKKVQAPIADRGSIKIPAQMSMSQLQRNCAWTVKLRKRVINNW